MIRALARVAFVNPLGDQGDRTVMLSTLCIANDEWHLEADFHHGNIGDVILYRNIDVNVKGAPANWQWYAAIPTANIKSYKLAGEMAPPSAVAVEASHAEQKAANPKAGSIVAKAD